MRITRSLYLNIVITLLLVSATTAILTIVGREYLSRHVLEDISSRNLSLARSISSQSWNALRRPAHSIEQLSKYFNYEKDRHKQLERIDALFSFCNLLEMVQVLDSSGHVTEVVPPRKEQLHLDLSRQQYFIKAKNNPGIQWTDFMRSGQTDSPIVTVSIAFSEGVIAGHINLTILSDISRIPFDRSNKSIAIIDNKGVIIANSDTRMALQGINLLNMEAVRKGLKGEAGTYSDTYNSRKGLASVVPIPETGWLAMVFQPEKDALTTIHQLQSYALWTLAMITVLSMALIIYFRKMLLIPIKKLTDRTEAISMGEYDVRVDSEYDEFMVLAHSFNNMAETIGERKRQIFHESQLNRAQAEIVRTITDGSPVETLYRMVHTWALELTGSTRGLVKIINLDKALSENADKADEADYVCYFNCEVNPDFPAVPPGEDSLRDMVFHNRKGFFSNDFASQQIKDTLPENHFPIMRILSVPIVHQDESLGQIVVTNSPREYTEEDLTTVHMLADLLAVAVNRIRADRILVSNESNMRKLRNYLSNIINSMPSVLIGVDQEGRITQWNRKAEQDSGLLIDEVLGKPLQDVLPHLSDEMDRIRLAVRTRQEQFDNQRARTVDGESRFEDLTIYPLMTNGIEGAVIRIDDVTSRVSLERMMVQSEKMMSVGGLAAGMAHEINNPLAAILGQSHNIQRRLLDKLPQNISAAEECGIRLEDLHAYIKKRSIPRMLRSIEDAGNRAATIVSNMLSFSRKSEKRMGAHSIAELMDKTIELASNDYDLKKEYDFRKIEIERHYEQDIPAVLCEGNEIQQVFLNLLRNGAEAMAEKDYTTGGPKFIIRIYTESRHVVIKVEDNGPGVDAKSRGRLFEPFYTSKEVGKGTGLGLSVSYFIITDQHSGSMGVESSLGEWTRFTVKLPLE
ncbi:ATP-binding protein [Maridesulfovibrio sp. FT414]|uniref:ATP-binding protein n=1 Tax=Maridesulfovibrio sp. FT414 TaxID=2979469 RepID=UPI003D8083E0